MGKWGWNSTEAVVTCAAQEFPMGSASAHCATQAVFSWSKALSITFSVHLFFKVCALKKKEKKKKSTHMPGFFHHIVHGDFKTSGPLDSIHGSLSC